MASLLEKAALHIKAGDIEKGKEILIQVIRQNPKDENAWLWMSRCVTDSAQKRDCFERVLRINPNNQFAQDGLRRVEKISSAPSVRPIHATSGKQDFSISKILLGSFFGLFVLSICGISVFVALRSLHRLTPITNNGQQPQGYAQRTNTITSPVSLSCQRETEEYIQRIQPYLSEFNDSVQVAGSTARIALGPIVQDMQRNRRDVDAISAPACAQASSRLLTRGIDHIINAFIDFMSDESELGISRQLQQGVLDIENASRQLAALSKGQVTPIPKQMPTNTDMATLSAQSIQMLTEIASPPTPTPTPLPSGQSISVDALYLDSRWRIDVDRIIITDRLISPITGTTEKASGRFAVVLLKVTNRGLSEEVFSANGNLIINDAELNQSVPNQIAALLASEVYDVDYISSINPDDTKIVVSVFDISKQSSFYVLSPGEFARSDSSGLLLNLP